MVFTWFQALKECTRVLGFNVFKVQWEGSAEGRIIRYFKCLWCKKLLNKKQWNNKAQHTVWLYWTYAHQIYTQFRALAVKYVIRITFYWLFCGNNEVKCKQSGSKHWGHPKLFRFIQSLISTKSEQLLRECNEVCLCCSKTGLDLTRISMHSVSTDGKHASFTLNLFTSTF